MSKEKLGFSKGDLGMMLVMMAIIAVVLLVGFVRAGEEIQELKAETLELELQIHDRDTVISAQEELLEAYRLQTDTTVHVLGQVAETLEALAYGPYTREEIQERIEVVAEVIAEINAALTPDDVSQISETLVLNAVAIDVDPMLLLSMAIVESHIRPNVRGGSGEYGMMQVMPGTGRWIAGRLGYENWQPADMFDVKMNTEFAAYYLWAVTKDMGGDTWDGVLAYNAGPTGGRNFIRAGNQAQDHWYVQRVMSTYNELRRG
ncbi:MAG: lytic transglycosylase domain-containing protein [Firmicutes bacterium]|nr:lytic transglycosylase domain-containing protein [Bacillota bacterium]